MKKTVVVKGVSIGAGMPKICVPIVEETEAGIYEKAEELRDSEADLVEWRADYFADLEKAGAIEQVLERLQVLLGEKPVLFTIRTAGEGGCYGGSTDAYYMLNERAACSGSADLVDIEALKEPARTEDVIRRLKACGCRVLASSHDFHHTPSEQEMVERLRQMEQAGADICKLAVMPECEQQVLALLSATLKVKEELEAPVVTMSMGALGMVSRLSGELFGSAITFGSAGRASAPGQLPVSRLKMILQMLHG